jgi:hypothetical protein
MGERDARQVAISALEAQLGNDKAAFDSALDGANLRAVVGALAWLAVDLLEAAYEAGSLRAASPTEMLQSMRERAHDDWLEFWEREGEFPSEPMVWRDPRQDACAAIEAQLAKDGAAYERALDGADLPAVAAILTGMIVGPLKAASYGRRPGSRSRGGARVDAAGRPRAGPAPKDFPPKKKRKPDNTGRGTLP